QGCVLLRLTDDGVARAALDRGRGGEPRARRPRPVLLQRNQDGLRPLIRRVISLEPAAAPRVRAVEVGFERPGRVMAAIVRQQRIGNPTAPYVPGGFNAG